MSTFVSKNWLNDKFRYLTLYEVTFYNKEISKYLGRVKIDTQTLVL